MRSHSCLLFLTHTLTRFPPIVFDSPCALFALLNCILQRSQGGPTVDYWQAPSPQLALKMSPLHNAGLEEMLLAAIIQALAANGGITTRAQLASTLTALTLRVSNLRDISFSLCATELRLRMNSLQILCAKGLQPPSAITAFRSHAEALLPCLRRLCSLAVLPARSKKHPAGIGGLYPASTPLGTCTFPLWDDTTTLFELLRVPVLHAWLPPPGSGVAAVLRKAPGLCREDVQQLMCAAMDKGADGGASLRAGLQPLGLTVAEFDVLNAHVAAGEPPHAFSTPEGLDAVSRVLAPGEFAALYGSGHFSTIFRYPRPHPQQKTHSLYRLASEHQLVEAGAAWGRLIVAKDGATEEVFCDADFRPLVVQGGDQQRRLYEAQLRQYYAAMAQEFEEWETAVAAEVAAAETAEAAKAAAAETARGAIAAAAKAAETEEAAGAEVADAEAAGEAAGAEAAGDGGTA